jgi:hypothetical protein
MLAKGMNEVPISIFIASRGWIMPPCRFSTSTAARPDASQLSTASGQDENRQGRQQRRRPAIGESTGHAGMIDEQPTKDRA